MGIRLLRINYTRILDSADAILSFANSKKLCRRNTQENIRHALLATNTEESILFLVSFYNTFITRQSSIVWLSPSLYFLNLNLKKSSIQIIPFIDFSLYMSHVSQNVLMYFTHAHSIPTSGVLFALWKFNIIKNFVHKLPNATLDV